MSNTAAIALVILIIALVVGFLWLVPFGNPEEEVLRVEEEKEVFEVPNSISADHFFADGVHTYSGKMDVPTPCHSIEYSVYVSDDGSVARINFLTNSSDDLCAQVITKKIFSVSLEANEDAFVSAAINGKNVILDIKEKEESETEEL